MKKFLSLMLSVILLLGSLSAFAEDGIEWSFKSSDRRIDLDSDIRKISGIIEVPAEIDGVSVLALAYGCFSGSDTVTGIALPDSVSVFKRMSLYNLAGLTSLTLPENLMVIMPYNLYNLPALESIVIPANVCLIDSALYNNRQMKSVTFEGVCPVVSDGGEVSLTLLAGDCVIYVPDDQLDAYRAAFAKNPDTVARIQPSGKNAVIPDWTAPEADFDFDPATGTILAYRGTAPRVDIPSKIGGADVTAIGEKAFLKNNNLVVVNIPEGVASAEYSSFQACYNLGYVSLPSTMKYVGDYAFASMSDLMCVAWKEGLEVLGKGAFKGANTVNVVVPDSVREIGEEALADCAVKTLALGAGVETIGPKAFASNPIESMSFGMPEMPEIAENAFDKNTAKCVLTLPAGIEESAYNDYAAFMAQNYTACTVEKPAFKPSFPALDAALAAPYAGVWSSVCAYDGESYYSADLLGLNFVLTLNEDATGEMAADGEVISGSWYVFDDYAFFGPEVTDCIAISLDENGRIVIDFGGILLYFEKEGAVYAAPAVPEMPWPELDQENAKSFIGVWKAVTFIYEGEAVDAALIGSDMTLYLNADGTAQLLENGLDSGMPLYWYAEYGVAYFGPTVIDCVPASFDGNGNLVCEQFGQTIIFAPAAEEIKIEGADEILGEWLDDFGNKLTVSADGMLTVTYAADGYVRELKWNMVDGMPMVTEGIWTGCPITVEYGILTITDNEGIYQVFSRDGNLSLQVPHIPAAFGDFEGGWICADDPAMQLLLLESGATLIDGSFSMPASFTIEDGVAVIDDMKLYMQEDGTALLNMGGVLYTFERGYVEVPKTAEGASLGDDAAPYIGEWTLVSMGGMDPSLFGMTMVLTLNADGSAVMSDGYSEDVGSWTMENGTASIMGDVVTINAEDQLVLSADGMDMIFEKTGGAQESSGASLGNDAAPYIGEWTLVSMGGMDPSLFGMTMVLTLNEDGSAVMSDGYSEDVGSWTMENGTASIMGDVVTINAEDQLVLSADGMDMIFEKTGGASGAQASGELSQFVGEWHLVYCATGGLTGDLRAYGLTGKLTLNADGTGSLSGISDEQGAWGEDEGVVRFGETGTPVSILDDGFLCLGTELAGYMIFSKDASAVWTPAPIPAPAAPSAVVTQPVAPAVTGEVQHVGTKFVCKSYTTFGQTMDASMLGAEYSLMFHENNTADLTMSGFTVPSLPYTVTADSVYQINYYGTMFNCTATETGFDMDYYGTMTMHFVPAE